MNGVPNELLKIVKSYLDITWIDEFSEKKLLTMIRNSISYFDSKSGIKNDYTVEGRAQSLLLIRVMYERSKILHEFEINYKKEIISFINDAKVKNYAKENRIV